MPHPLCTCICELCAQIWVTQTEKPVMGMHTHTHTHTATCTTTELVVPIFGQLILITGDEQDITRNRSAIYQENTRIEYRCANGYQPYDPVGNVTLTGAAAITTCTITMEWSLLNVECRGGLNIVRACANIHNA